MRIRKNSKNNQFIEHSLLKGLAFLKASIFAEEYASRKGFLQSLDPRIKMVTMLFFLSAAVVTKNIFVVVCLYAFCLVLAFFSKIPIGFFLKRTWIFIPFFSLFILLPAIFSVFSPGDTLLSIKAGSLSLIITRQGVGGVFFVIARIVTAVSFAVLLNLSTMHARLLKVLRVFKIPQVFVMTLGMCYRYIYLFVEMIENMYMGMKSRIGSSLPARKGQQIVTWSIASLWQRSYQLNNQVYAAMLSRGYRGEAYEFDEYKTNAADWIWLFFSALIFVCLLYITYMVKWIPIN